MNRLAIDLNRIDEYRKTHNTSVLAVMFTDIEGFTAYTSEHGDLKSSQLVNKHNDVLSQAIESCDGLVIKQIGDSFLAIFADPSLSVKAALTIQKDLRDAEFPLKIRIGIHMGQIALVENISSDIFGTHVNIASRVESLARGGQIFVTKSIYDSAHTWIRTEDLKFEYHGRTRLKGIEGKEDIYQIGHANANFAMPQVIWSLKKRKILVYAACFIIIASLIGIAAVKLVRQKDKITEIERTPGMYIECIFDEVLDYDDGIEYTVIVNKKLTESLSNKSRLVVNRIFPNYRIIDYTAMVEEFGYNFKDSFKSQKFFSGDNNDIRQKMIQNFDVYPLSKTTFWINRISDLNSLQIEIRIDHILWANNVLKSFPLIFSYTIDDEANYISDLCSLMAQYIEMVPQLVGQIVDLYDKKCVISRISNAEKMSLYVLKWNDLNPGDLILVLRDGLKTLGAYKNDIGYILEVDSITDSLIIADIEHAENPEISLSIGDFVYK